MLDVSVVEPKLLGAVRELIASVKAAGGRALMVGGAVRDLALGAKSVKDIDIEVYGLSPEKLRRVVGEKFSFDECGVSFGVMKLRDFEIDVAIPRREAKTGEGHRAFAIEPDPTLSIEEAARRRDFTINAMYYDPDRDEIIDPYGGMSDLRAKVMRHVSERFREDPLRVLRGMQFAARFELIPHPDTVKLCRTISSEGLARERLMEEWAKLLLKGKRISVGLSFLRETGWVKYYPELEKLIGCEQDPHWHPEGDVWNHTLCCLDAYAQERIGNRQEDLIVGLAVLCHDLGKPHCTRYDPIKGRIRSLGHDEAGVEPTRSFLRRLTEEERLLLEVPPLVRLHMRPFAMWKDRCSDSAIRRLAAQVVRIDRLIRVAAADDKGRLPFPSETEPLRWLAAQAERLAVEASAPKPILMGRHLIEMGMKPSPKFKEILTNAFDAQLDGKFSTLEDAKRYVQAGGIR